MDSEKNLLQGGGVKVTDEKFSLDNENILLKNCYEQGDNYLVEVLDNESNICIIFFSGNGLYYPNEKSVFNETIVKNNRYEWWTVGHSEEIVKFARKVIYVRDIYKQFYVKGINIEIDCIDKLCVFLKKLTDGYRIITCGVSAGGYIATIVGIYLKAIAVYNFGGQFTLEYELKSKIEPYFMKLYENDRLYNQFFNLVPIIKRGNTPIWFFYSALCKNDIEQMDYLKNGGGRM